MRTLSVAVLVAVGSLAASPCATAAAGATGRTRRELVRRSATNGEAAKNPGDILSDATAALNGASAVVVSGTVEVHDDGSSRGTLYVAATGAPYPLGMVRTDGKTGQIFFSHYGSARVPAPPAQSISLAQLQAAGT